MPLVRHFVRVAMRAPLLPGLLALGAGGSVAPVHAQEPVRAVAPEHHADLSLAFRFGTLGLGLEANKLLTSHLSARVGANFFQLSTSHTETDISYAATLKLHGVSALLDLYPGARGSFHFTGGIFANPLTVSGTGQPNGGVFVINGDTYSAAQVGTLTGVGKFPDIGPYAGFGFGTPARKGGPVSFLFDLGAVIGQAKVALAATGAATNPQLAADLQAQSAQTQHDVDKYAKVFPVLSFGIAYRL